jgi:hypothetical protein
MTGPSDSNERHLILSLQQAGTRLANQLAKVEREVRDVALDRDRWKRRAQEAETIVASVGIESKKSLRHSDSGNPDRNQKC